MAARHSKFQPAQAEAVFHRFADYLYARRGLAPITVHNYVAAMRRLAPVIGLRPTPAAIDRHIATMRQGGASYAHIVSTAQAIERYTEFLGAPIKLGRPKKPKPLLRGTLTEAEISILIAATRTLRERALLSVLAYSGVRNRELCRLQIGDIDVAAQVIRISATKTAKDRAVALPASCMAVLMDYLHARAGKPDERLFVTMRHGYELEPQDVRKLLKTIARRAHITKRVWPHLLRHSLATNLLSRGAHLLTIQQQLGHAYIDTTMLYLHAVPARLQLEYRLFAPSYL